MELCQQLQTSSSMSDYSRCSDDLNFQDYKFHLIKCREETKTGFPILPVAINPSFYDSTGNCDIGTAVSTCSVPLRKLPDNCENFLVSGIRSFLRRCYNDADKRRRSSRVCKHKPGVKHYCRRKNWDIILSKYKSEILENPLLNLGAYFKINFSNLTKELFRDKQNKTNNMEEPTLTSQKQDTAQHIESSNQENNENVSDVLCEITSQNGPSVSSSSYSEHLEITSGNELDDMSSFLAIFGLKRKPPQKDIENYNDEKCVKTDLSNNEDAKCLVDLCKTTGGTALESSAIGDMEEKTQNEVCVDMNSVCDDNVEEDKVPSEEYKENKEVNDTRTENVEQGQEGKDNNEVISKSSTEDIEDTSNSYERTNINEDTPSLEHSIAYSTTQECICHNVERPSHENETHISMHSTPDMNDFLVDSLLRNGSWNTTTCPQAHSSPRKNETRELVINGHEQDLRSFSNRMTSNFQVPYSVPHSAHMCTPRQMYTQTSGMSAVFPNFYGSPCIPTPILAASQLTPPIIAYNFLPMNNVICASHPGIMPIPNHGTYISNAFDCTSQHSIHQSLPLSYHSAQSNPSTLYHKPGFHQWVNVNASAMLPCWTQSTFIGGSQLPCCGGATHSLEASYITNDGHNGFIPHPTNSDFQVGSDVLNGSRRNPDDVK